MRAKENASPVKHNSPLAKDINNSTLVRNPCSTTKWESKKYLYSTGYVWIKIFTV